LTYNAEIIIISSTKSKFLSSKIIRRDELMQRYNRSRYVVVELKEGVATITLNRPDRLNAIDNEMHQTLEELFVELDKDSRIRAIVITGAGKAFCSGGDVKEMDGHQQGLIQKRDFAPTRHGRHLLRNMLECEPPIIAAINGDAAGLGASIALLCDVIFAAEAARIGDTHARVGLAAGDGSAVIWSMLCGVARAKQYLMTGDLISAREAERIGLVNTVVPDGKAYEEAWKFAKRLADGPIQAIKWTKYSVNKLIKDQINLTLDTALALESLTFLTEDHREASRAFVEKRPPVFQKK
jgi:enoyl-CoA hydratase